MKKILVLCTGNSCRSQMMHGFLKQNKNLEVYSAGTQQHGLNPTAVKVMQEIGIDISEHTSNLVDEYVSVPFDYQITVCDMARESCPVFPGNALKIHHSFPDPAKFEGSEEEQLNEFRRVRDLIGVFADQWVKEEIMSS